jgi:hypothetical protein
LNIKFQIKDGKFSPEGMVEAAKMAVGPNDPHGDADIAKIETMAEECKSVEHEDR